MPKRRRPLAVAALLLFALAGCDAFGFGGAQSALTYRLPYADGTMVEVTADADTHEPQGAYDLRAFGGLGLRKYRVVAAQAGVVRYIVDDATNVCCDGDCANNYVWIEHARGEWSKYSHMATGSVTDDAGLAVGDEVEAGTFLGYESDVGRACGVHLHFEVGVPDDPAEPLVDESVGELDGERVVPRFCGVEGGTLYEGDEVEAAGCGVE